MVFRGQSNSVWTVKSTLERSGVSAIPLKKFYTSIDYLKPEINSLGHNFQRKISDGEYDFDFTGRNQIDFDKFPDLEYLTYLRHHGFPTPLIDVTQSEYVALFFACEDLNEKTDAKVFVFRGDLGEMRGTGIPELHRIGHYLESDRRHIAQQSEYLVTVQFQRREDYSEWAFIPFSSFMEEENTLINDADSDAVDEKKTMYEIEIDGNATKNIMAELAKMNINHYTLYLDEDSLVQKLKYECLRKMLPGS